MASPTSAKSIAAEAAYQGRLSAMTGSTPITTQNQAIQSSVSKTGSNPLDSYTPKPSNNLLDYRLPNGEQVLYPMGADGKQIIPQGKLDPSATDIQGLNAPTSQITPTQPVNPVVPTQVANNLPQNQQNSTPSGIPGMPNLVGTQADQATQAIDQLKQKYGSAFNTLNQSGVKPSADMGAGMSGVNTALGTVAGAQAEGTSIVGGIMETDTNFDSILTMYDEFMSPAKQKQSLLDEYKQMESSLGIQAMNAELIDAKRIIEGTEDDIRSEVTAAGGFATDSQVLALSNARNKSLIKNYNYLLESRDNARTQLTTMMNLSIQDREFANSEFDRKIGFAMKIAEFKERATTNARNTYMTLGDKMGFDTLFSSMSPYEQSIAQKTMGITPQQAQQLSLRSQQDRMSAMAKEAAQTKLIEAQTRSADRANQSDDVPTVKSINGVDSQWNPSTKKWDPITSQSGGGQLRTAQAEQDIQLVEGLINDKNIRTAVGPTGLARFIGKGFDTATGGRQNFIAGVEQLRSQLSLDSLIDAKARGATFGALSEGELKVLSASASKLGTWAKKDGDGNVVAYNASEANFKKELEKINNFAKLDYILKGGDPSSVGVTIMPNGIPAIRNSDGTYTELQ